MNTGKTSPCASGEKSVLSLSKGRVRGLLELAPHPGPLLASQGEGAAS